MPSGSGMSASVSQTPIYLNRAFGEDPAAGLPDDSDTDTSAEESDVDEFDDQWSSERSLLEELKRSSTMFPRPVLVPSTVPSATQAQEHALAMEGWLQKRRQLLGQLFSLYQKQFESMRKVLRTKYRRFSTAKRRLAVSRSRPAKAALKLTSRFDRIRRNGQFPDSRIDDDEDITMKLDASGQIIPSTKDDEGQSYMCAVRGCPDRNVQTSPFCRWHLTCDQNQRLYEPSRLTAFVRQEAIEAEHLKDLPMPDPSFDASKGGRRKKGGNVVAPGAEAAAMLKSVTVPTGVPPQSVHDRLQQDIQKKDDRRRKQRVKVDGGDEDDGDDDARSSGLRPSKLQQFEDVYLYMQKLRELRAASAGSL